MQQILKKTKIVGTIGPSSESKEMLKKLFEAGVDIMRLNFSHGTHEEQLRKINTAREIEKEVGKLFGICLDTKGPEIRTGRFVDKHVSIKNGDTVYLEMGCTDENGNDKLGGRQPDGTIRMGITYEGLFDDAKIFDHIRMDDGKLDMIVTSKDEKNRVLVCLAGNDDDIKDERGVNCPDTHLSMPYVSEQDKKDLIFGCKHHVNYCSASFVRSKKDIDDIREIFKQYGGTNIRIISKVENTEAIKNLEEIIVNSDAIMVARGDMGVQIPAEDVPVIQMKMVKDCRRLDKPIIIATQMLDSMIHSPFPTRAEVSDVANAVLQSADAVMLSGESANGDYPLEAVNFQSRIAIRMEKELDYLALAREGFHNSQKTEDDAMANAVVNAAYLTSAKFIINFAHEGTSANRLSHCRPACPALFVTDNKNAGYDSILWWGIYPIYVERLPKTLTEMEKEACNLALQNGAQVGDNIIITSGDNHQTNLMKIIKVTQWELRW